MGQTFQYVLTRGQETRNAQASIEAAWVWSEMTVSDWDSLVLSFQSQQQKATQAETAMLGIRGNLDAGLLDLRTRTVVGISSARVRFRNDTAAKAVVDRLHIPAKGRGDILAQALDWESAWQQIDPTWCPTTTNTLEAFQKLRSDCIAWDGDYSRYTTDWRSAAAKLRELASTLHERNVSWYAVATAVFPPGTTEGDLIRRSITTKYYVSKSEETDGDDPDEADETDSDAEAGEDSQPSDPATNQKSETVSRTAAPDKKEASGSTARASRRAQKEAKAKSGKKSKEGGKESKESNASKTKATETPSAKREKRQSATKSDTAVKAVDRSAATGASAASPAVPITSAPAASVPPVAVQGTASVVPPANPATVTPAAVTPPTAP